MAAACFAFVGERKSVFVRLAITRDRRLIIKIIIILKLLIINIIFQPQAADGAKRTQVKSLVKAFKM
uniref:Uncharacterized protein n=1 Tax=Anopheles minimus TaxID=112268 RepID=A0A182WQ29_9DIPT